MRAVHLEQGRVSVVNKRAPRYADDFALIRVLYAGICNTDLELRRGYYGFRGTPGHEFVGEVLEAGNKALVGKRVAGEINLACGNCEWCARGLGRHCPRRTVLGIVKHPGAFATLLTLPERNLHVLPRALPLEYAVFVEPLAAACEILDQVKIPSGAATALLGDGKLGLLIAQVLHANGIALHHYGRHRDKLRISRDAGIETRLTARTPAAAYDFVIEATGSPAALVQAVRMTRPRGTLVMKSTVHGLVPLDTAPVIVNELTLVGSRCGRFEAALRLLRSGKVNVAPLLSDILPLEEAPRAFDRAAERGVLKIVLQPR